MFNELIGNNNIKEQLESSIKSNQIAHSYLFIGIEGIGKKEFAKEFAKAILCLNENKYCNKCKSCIEFDGNNNPDFFILKPDGNSIKINQIREMQEKLQEKPITSSKKVYIIDDADKMTTEAQNSLLKTLEEPPEFVTIILIGTNENSFLATIKSRCIIIHFNQINNDELKKYLEKNNVNNVSEDMLEIFQGSVGRALNLKDKKEQYLQIKETIENIGKYDIIDFVHNANLFYQDKDEINELLNYTNILLLKLARYDVRYTNCIKIVENTKQRLKQNANYEMSIDNMLFNIWEEIN